MLVETTACQSWRVFLRHSIVFSCQTSWQWSYGDPRTGAVGGGSRNRDSGRIDDTGMYRSTVHVCLRHRDRHTSVTSMNTSKRREENLSVRSGKFEAEMTNNRRLRSTYCRPTIETNYWQTDRHEASRGLSATAGLLVALVRALTTSSSHKKISRWYLKQFQLSCRHKHTHTTHTLKRTQRKTNHLATL